MPTELLAIIIFAGAFAQSASGVGFGIVSGPFLLLAYGYERAVVETAALSLLVAVVTSVRLVSHADRRAMVRLCVALPFGVALGLGAVRVLPQAVILACFGLMLVGMGLSVLRQLRRARAPASVSGTRDAGAVRVSPRAGRSVMATAGVLAGIGAALFASPGPAAAWGLARSRLNAAAIRGTLAAYFVVAYLAILVAFAALGATEWVDGGFLLWMAPVCVAGSVLGVLYGERLSAVMLRRIIGWVVTASGVIILLPLVRALG